MARRIVQNRPNGTRYSVARSAAAPATRSSVQTAPELKVLPEANKSRSARKQGISQLIEALDYYATRPKLLLELDDLYTRLYAYVRSVVSDPLYTYVAGGNVDKQEAKADLEDYFSDAPKSLHLLAHNTMNFLFSLVESQHLDDAEELVNRGSDRLTDLIQRLA